MWQGEKLFTITACTLESGGVDKEQEKTCKIHIPFPLHKPCKTLLDDTSYMSKTALDEHYKMLLRERIYGRSERVREMSLSERMAYMYCFESAENNGSNTQLLSLDYSIKTPLDSYKYGSQGHYPIFRTFEQACRYCSENIEIVDYYTSCHSDSIIKLANEMLSNMDILMKCFVRYL